MIILGIETSCDETAASVIEGKGDHVEILSNVVSSQIEIHKKYGGVVPEVAAREHVLNILPVINEALEKTDLSPQPPLLIKRGVASRASRGEVDAIAVTTGPGLITSLIVGVETAKTLACAWNIPLISINHIEGHIYANFIGENSKLQIPNYKQISNSKIQNPKVKFPVLILTVSGGHNLLVLMTGHGKYKIIGETLDDAAGEAFDKAAQILGLGYPGGPAISAAAEKFQAPNTKSQTNLKIQNSNSKNKSKILNLKSEISLPRPMFDSKNYDFSFSGLKTALLYKVKQDPNYKKRINEYAHEFQQAAIDVLISKTIKAAKEYKVKTIMLSGGVSANKELRIQMENAIKEKLPTANYHLPNLNYTTDNAAMIATAGYFKFRRQKNVFLPSSWNKIQADCNQKLK
ncbi:MAG: tRNA (adenosine(37)-N6)-threonylcarbamoyltransferase complex transferase subunit TsaD [Patescibacteria group bacterium]|nr:tRNA (adenosine(37)-N6)-threonylcarbamoyltransferase complex transferase subunit TsaD [Patescibacteria group bacterium]MDD4610635.1 tRNA (adenosine(37)-N6)-threonylcarbamoyltransferase complex transferase subunit TsaD [Patescibacteria group bacterium]